MSTRTTRKTVTFNKPFSLETGCHSLPAGSYEVITDEELIEGLSFPVYRRIATMMMVPAQFSHSSVQMLAVDPAELAAALKSDASASEGAAMMTKS